MLLWLIYKSSLGSNIVNVLHSSPFKVIRFVWLDFIWVMSSGRNTIITQYIETYKIEALDNNLTVIIIFCTITSIMLIIEGHTKYINQG